MRGLIKKILTYKPSAATTSVRRLLREGAEPSRPYCPDWEGDFLWTAIKENGYRRAAETGFGTGSTAAYMLDALPADGSLVSIDWSADNFNHIGRQTIERLGAAKRHTLIEEQSWRVLPRLLAGGREFDLVFIDGWKTFDYLAYELFLFNRMLAVGGMIVFDDSYLPAVRKAARLLKRHYGYREADYGDGWRLRLFHVLTRRSLHRPFRALQKILAVDDQQPTRDWTFYRPL
jgi:predicted O-methyltransferase YrrM